MTDLEAGLVARDLDRLLDFYTGPMGFRVAERLEFPASGTVVKLRRGGARMKLFAPNDVVDPPERATPWFRPGGWRYAALLVDDGAEVDRLATAVAAAGGDVLVPAFEHRPGARMALVADPEGNTWEILADAVRT